MKNNYPRLEVSESVRRKMVEVARQFRKEATKREQILCQPLRGKKLDGLKFRRQQPVGLNIMRIKAELVENNLPKVLEMIRAKIHDLELNHANYPSLKSGEGQGGGE